MGYGMNTTENLFSTFSDYNYDYGDLFRPCDTKSANTFRATFLPVLYSLVFVFGLFGNALVLWALMKHKRLKNMTDIYLFNLSLSDLLFVTTLPFWAYSATNEWIFGDFFCKVVSAAYEVGYFGGTMFIILITIDRYLAIVHVTFSVRTRTARNGIISSVVMWCVALFASLPTMIFNKIEIVHDRFVCHTFFPQNSFANWKLFILYKSILLGFFVPLSIMVFCYIRIIQTLRKTKNYKKHRAIKLIFTVVIVFFIFWTPYNVVILLESLREQNVLPGCEFQKQLMFAQQVTECITFIHCCLNPIIYAFLGERFRMYLHRLFHSCLPSSIRYKTAFPFSNFTSSNRSQSSGDHDSSTFI
ncbi:C-C chemokine receptor type 4-like isoform X2 [Stegostoma tigrinum]|nr:C-C chemokine receptor type 4-like isoform X2 [Stegostoma tigrinum]XP_048380025.1 C-C chemokine receptor type 4-like isoform X2 [Stegostoma tigrinum]XP_048380033.1 C-C chemokine receptor type 4-like isoform X2 [Stegostoma tigrinum]